MLTRLLDIIGHKAVLLGAVLSYLLTGGNYTLYLIYHTAGRFDIHLNPKSWSWSWSWWP